MKFVHIRRIDDETGKLLAGGGLTIAYSEVVYGDAAGCDIVFNVAQCSEKDIFCHKTGREVATNRMKKDGPLDVIPGNEHPRAQMLVDWIAHNFYSNGSITITQKNIGLKKIKTGYRPRYRWESTFQVRNPDAC